MVAETLDPQSLQVGDRFAYQGTVVEVLRPATTATDRFGRPMLEYWCRRADTGAEGVMWFGPGAKPLTRADLVTS